jgi:hypothetical protein
VPWFQKLFTIETHWKPTKDDSNLKKSFQKMETKCRHICTIFSKGHVVLSIWEKTMRKWVGRYLLIDM